MEVSNQGLEESKKAIKEANKFLYISMAWWLDDSVGRELFNEVKSLSKKNVDIRVEMRPDPKNEQIQQKLSELRVPVTQIVEFHGKAICNEKRLLIMNENYFEKDMLRNINFRGSISDLEEIEKHKKEFLERSSKPDLQLDGPEVDTHKSKLIKEKKISDLLDWQKLNPLQSKVCRHVLYGDENLLVIAPTGSGKTLIGELALFRSILLKNKRAVWIVPSRALAKEITETLDKIQSDHIRPVKCLGNEEISNESLKNGNIWICTTEKFESLLRKQSIESVTFQVETIIVDEIHLLGERGRGQVLESILSRYKDRINIKRLVGLSATLENSEEFAGWLNARLLKPPKNWKPNYIHKEVIPFEAKEGDSQKTINESKNKLLIGLLEIIKSNPDKSGPVIIFCGSKSKCRNRALALAYWQNIKETSIEFKKSLEDDDISLLKEEKIGVYYRGASYAEEFLNLYKNQKCDYLFATTGLAQGVNLPAKHVIILDTVLGLDTNLDLNKAEQMLGRAGRIYGSEGWGYLVCPSYEFKKWEKEIGIKSSDVNSVIDQHLPDVLLAEFFLENIKSEKDAFDFYRRSFKAYQSKKDTETISLEITESLDFLLNNDFIERKENDQFTTTEVGRATIQFMVDTNIAVSLINSCSKLEFPSSYKKAEMGIIKMLSDALPKSNIYEIDFDLEVFITEKLSSIGINIKEDQAIDYLAFIAMYLALNEPSELSKVYSSNREISNYFRELLEDKSPRYLNWVSRIGKYTRSPWVVFCSFDISKRLKWYKLAPETFRGSSKLINFLEQLLNPEEVSTKLPKAWRSAIENEFTTPLKLKKDTKELSFSKNKEAIKRRINSLIRLSDINLEYDELKNRIRLTGIPKDTKAVYSEVFKPNSQKGSITYITSGRDYLLSIPFGENKSNNYKILINIETTSDRDLFAFEKTIVQVEDKNKEDKFKELLNESIDNLPSIQKLNRKKGFIRKIKKRLSLIDIDESELNEWVLAKRQYFVELVEIINQEYFSPLDKSLNINSTINGLIELRSSFESDPFNFRSISSILKSRVGTKLERELCKLCLASNAGLNFGIVMGEGSGSYYSMCEIDNKWYAFESISNITPKLLFPRTINSSKIELIRRFSNNSENKTIDISWVKGFQQI